jgi:hypothetical protein
MSNTNCEKIRNLFKLYLRIGKIDLAMEILAQRLVLGFHSERKAARAKSIAA